MSLQGDASGGYQACAGTAGTVPQSGICSPDMDLPWGWVLENLLDVKNLPLSFFRDFLPYVPHIEQPQSSKLLQKLALRFLNEGAVTDNIDTGDDILLKFILKEQGVSNLRRIHSLKESLENDLTLRVETETVLTNLRSKDGRVEWAAFGAAVDRIFPEDFLEPRRVERRTELAAVLPDPSNGDSEDDVCEHLLKKYPLEELCRDLGHFIGDKRKSFKIKFLDQLLKDVEDGVYSLSPGSDSQTPSKLLTDFRNGCQVENDSQHATALPGSSSPKSKCTTPDKDGGRDPCYPVAGAKDSEPSDARAEMSFRIIEGNEVGHGFTNETHKFDKVIAKLTEDVPNAASVPFSTPGHSHQKISSLAAPIAGNPLSMQQSSFVICPAQRAEGDLKIDKPLEDQRECLDCRPSVSLDISTGGDTLSQHRFASGAGTSRISPEKDTKRTAAETLDQDTGVAKKRKLDDVELSDEERTPIAATGKNVVDMMDDGRLSENVPNLSMRCSEIYANDLLPAGVVECCVCASSGGSKIFCHRCPVSIHEGCLSELRITQANEENCWYCVTCDAKMAQEAVVKAQVDVKEANEALRKAEEEKLTKENRLIAFLNAKMKRSRRRPKDQTASAEHRNVTLCGKIPDTTKSKHAEQGSPMDFRSDLEDELRKISAKSGTVASKGVRLSDSAVQNVTEDQTVRHVDGIRKDIMMQTGRQASVLREGLDDDGDNGFPDADLPRQGIDGQVSTSVHFLPVSQGLAPEDKSKSGYCAKEQLGGPRCSPDRVPTMVPTTNDSKTKSAPQDVRNENVRAANAATSGSRRLRSHGGDSSSPSNPLFNSRSSEGEEGDGHDGDLEEVCEGSLAAAERTNAADQAAGVIRERISEASNVRGKSLPRQVYRARKKIPGIRRQNLPWTRTEEDVLKEGVKMHSKGGEYGFHWARILAFGEGKFCESRTAVDLKDKWRNMKKARRPVSPDLSS